MLSYYTMDGALKRGLRTAVLVAAFVVFFSPEVPALDAPRVPKILDAGPVNEHDAREVQAEFEDYLRRARVLKKYHDAGKLYEQDVFRELRQEGVIPSLGQGFRPFQVPVYKGKWCWPLHAGVISSQFGPRWGRKHEGIDIAANFGSPVYAAAAGKVIYAGHGLRGYGNVVILRHDQKTTTLYAHNQALKVHVGESVVRGQVIALLGSTGRSTGPHVHFEIRIRKQAVNPRKVLPKSQFFLDSHKA